MITRSRRSLEKISYERSPLPCSRVRHGFQVHSKDVPTVCSMTIGTKPFALGDDQSEARGCDSREPLKSEKCLLQFREASRVGRLRVASERNMTGRRIQVSPSLDSRVVEESRDTALDANTGRCRFKRFPSFSFATSSSMIFVL